MSRASSPETLQTQGGHRGDRLALRIRTGDTGGGYGAALFPLPIRTRHAMSAGCPASTAEQPVTASGNQVADFDSFLLHIGEANRIGESLWTLFPLGPLAPLLRKSGDGGNAPLPGTYAASSVIGMPISVKLFRMTGPSGDNWLTNADLLPGSSLAVM